MGSILIYFTSKCLIYFAAIELFPHLNKSHFSDIIFPENSNSSITLSALYVQLLPMGDVLISPICTTVLTLLGLFSLFFCDIIITAALPQQVCYFRAVLWQRPLRHRMDVLAAAYFIQDHCRRRLERDNRK